MKKMTQNEMQNVNGGACGHRSTRLAGRVAVFNNPNIGYVNILICNHCGARIEIYTPSYTGQSPVIKPVYIH